MPRGKYVNHKGRSRKFTAPEELQQESDEETSSGEEVEGAAGTSATRVKKPTKKQEEDSSDEESDEESEDDRGAKKGVAGLIAIENPNRQVRKAATKVKELTLDDEEVVSPSKPELSRREREQIEKQKQRQKYEKMHAEGKTTEAKADLARLAIIRQQRAEAAAKREAERKALESKK